MTTTIKLYNGDCLEEMKKISDGSIDLVLTDPPYGTTQCKWDSIIPLAPMWKQLKRITKPNGAIVLMAGQPFTSALIMSNIGMFKYCWVWDKVNRITNFLNVKKQPLRKCENIVVFYQKQPTYNPQMVKGKPYKTTHGKGTKNYGSQVKTKYESDGMRYPQDLIIIEGDERGTVGRIHPTQKPIVLMEYLIKTYTNERDTVLDFTAGSFTTAIACLNMRRNFVGIELDRDYFEIGKERIEKHLKGLDYEPKMAYN